MPKMESLSTRYDPTFEYSLFGELFVSLGQICNTPVQNYNRHLTWHGFELCWELFRRRLYSGKSAYRQSRQFLLGWLTYINEKIALNDWEFAVGLCDSRCYKLSDITVDRYLFDETSLGPQIPPPTRLRLRLKSELAAAIEDTRTMMTTTTTTTPSRIDDRFEKTERKPHREGKLSTINVNLEERLKRYDEFKEIKYVANFLKMLTNNARYAQYVAATEICRHILKYRYERKIPFSRSDSFIDGKLVEASKAVTMVTKTYVIDERQET